VGGLKGLVMSKKSPLAAGALALAVSSAFAQSATETTNPLYQLASLDPVVVSASRFEEPRGQATVPVDVISGDEIQAAGVTNVVEFLDSLSGVGVTRQYGNLGVDASVDIGYLGGASQQSTLILIDGVRINDVDNSAIRFAQIPLSLIDRIEVRKAGGGALFGDRAIGGVVNIITKRDRNETSVSVSRGSFDYQKIDAFLSRSSETLGFRLNAFDAKTDGFRRDSSQSQKAADIAARIKIATVDLTLEARTYDENARLPQAISHTEFLLDPKNPGGYRTIAERDGEIYSLRLDRQEREGFDYSIVVGKETHINTAKYDIPAWGVTRYETERVFFSSQIGVKRASVRAITGVEYSATDSDSSRTNRARVSQDSKAVFGLVEADLDKTKVSVGARYQPIKNAFLATPSSPSQQTRESLSSWSIGAYTSTRDFGKFRYGVSSSFAFPTTDQLFTFDPEFYTPIGIYPGVEAMRSRDIYVTWDSTITESISPSISARRVLVEGEIGLRNDCFGDGTADCNDNLYDTKRYIFSAGLDGKLGSVSRYSLGIDFIDAEIESGEYAGKRVPLIPARVVRAALRAKLKGTTVTASAHYRSAMHPSSDNLNQQFMVPARTILNMSAQRELSKHLTASLWVRNLTDEKYYDYAAYQAFSNSVGVAPANGRNVELIVRVVF
jgi:iron complex outermembrane recepter protein